MDHRSTLYPEMLHTTSFIPLRPVSDIDKISKFQLFKSEKRWYIENRSAANSEASSPPVPALISRIEFFLSLSSFGIRSFIKSVSRIVIDFFLSFNSIAQNDDWSSYGKDPGGGHFQRQLK